MKHSAFLKSAAILSAGGVVAKGIGAVYRIVLVKYLGGYGMGLYQMAYPFFVLLLTLSSTGIPSAFSRIIAREEAAGRRTGPAVSSALRLFFLVGICGGGILCLLAPVAGGLQGNGELTVLYYALSPAVLFVALISVLRGYFQGRRNMLPTAASEVVEQLVKVSAGLLLAMRFQHDPVKAAAGALFAVSLSELVCLVFLFLLYRKEPVRGTLVPRKMSWSHIFSSAFPVMAATSLLPLSQTADSILIVRLLQRHTARSVALYGLYAGGALSLIHLPVSVCYGLAAASVPVLSHAAAKGDGEGARRRAAYALILTFLLAVPAAVALFFFAGPAVKLLYGSLSGEDASWLVRLVRLSSVSTVTLASIDTLAACLTGMGRAKHAALGMLLGITVKFLLQLMLVSRPAFSVGGAAIAMNACYLVAFFLDLYYTFKQDKKEKKYDHGHRVGDAKRGCVAKGVQEDAGGG